MHREVQDSRDTERLSRLYIAALTTVAVLSILGQVLVQKSLRDQTGDAGVINVAGRQRMLSQRLVLNAMALHHAADPAVARDRAATLSAVRDLWNDSHDALRTGHASMHGTLPNSPAVAAMFAELDGPYRAMDDAVARILAQAGSGSRDAMAGPIETLLRHETPFLTQMDAIVGQYELEARNRVNTLRMLEVALLCTTLIVLLLEGLFIFRPAVRRIRQAMGALRAAEADLATIFNEAPALIWRQDLDGRIALINETAAAVFGESPHALQGRPV